MWRRLFRRRESVETRRERVLAESKSSVERRKRFLTATLVKLGITGALLTGIIALPPAIVVLIGLGFAGYSIWEWFPVLKKHLSPRPKAAFA